MLTIEDRLSDDAGVDRLPDAAIHSSEVERGCVAGNARSRHRPAPAKWPNQPPFQGAEEFRGDSLRARRKQADTSHKKDEKRGFENFQRAVLRLESEVVV